MKTTFKRILSLLMVLVMLGSMLPAVYADDTAAPNAEPVVLTDEDYAIVDDVFAQIDAMEDAPAKKNATRTQVTDAAAQIVMASENYVEGSLERNGNSFTWWTDEGIRCIYNPYMREKYANMRAPENAEAAGIYNEPKATKGGWPSGNQVYLIAPYYGIDDTFTDQYKNEAKSIASAIGDTDGYTLYSGSSVTVDKVADAIENGAVVIFDSHGTTDYDGSYVCDDPDGYEVYDYVSKAKYSYLCLTSKTGLTTEDYNDGATYFTDSDGYMCACVNGAAIANHMDKNSPAGLLWMAICLGMATDTMCEPMREKGVEVVYGYSQSVTFAGDYCFEETFWDNMIAGKDVATSIAAMKSKWGNWDWSEAIATEYGYSGSGYTLAEARKYRSAFPIVVSDEDTHPGQRDSGTNYGACSEQTVKSTYTLYSQYTVTAQSNNANYGSVSVNGSTITATPATGYFAESATVTSGTATVTQNGNTFSVSASSDCTVQINFAPKTSVTVNFSGANVAGQTGYAGDSMSLPTDVDAPDGYKFLGWTTAPLSSETTEKPSYYTDSFIPTANTTLYALYSYVDSTSGGGSGDYVKVTETPADWSGEYLIVYEDGSRVFDGSLSTLEAVSNYQDVTITNSTISAEEADAYRFIIAAMDGGYSIQSASGKYISGTSGSNKLNEGTTAAANTISIDASGNADIVSNTSHLRYNATSGQDRFRYYKSTTYSSQKDIALYVKDGSAGTTYYISTLCDHENTIQVAEIAATCVAEGCTAGVKCSDCNAIISGCEVIPAAGHSWSKWNETTAPGCETAGEQTHTCATCGETETQAVAALGHSMNDGEITTAATCTADGVKTYTCSACGATTTETIPATGHSYVDGVCSSCGEAEPEVTGYYIAAIRSSGNYFYMTSDLGTASTERYQAVDSGLTTLPESITDPEAGYVFILIDNGDGTYSIQADGVEGDNYLGHTSGNSGTLVAEASALKLTMTDNGDGTYSFSYAASDATRYLALNGTTGNNYFAWYKSGQKQNLVLIPVGGTAEPEVTEPVVTEPVVTEPVVTEPEVTEPEATEPEATQPAGSVTELQYVFSDYTAGTQYAEGEEHTLDEVVTLTINGAHLNQQVRLYAGSNAVFTSTKEIDSIVVKAGYKADTLNVYASADGSTWELVSAQATTTSYTEYSFDIPDGSYYVKLESVGAQIRVSEMTINVIEGGSTEPEVTEPEVTEPEATEPEVTEPEVTEPESSEPVETQPVAGAEATIDFSTTDQRVSQDANAQVWANGGATLTNNKGSSTSDVANFFNPARFYKNSDIIITFPGMTKIEFTCNTAAYATTLASSISGATVSTNGQVVTVVFASTTDEFSFTLSSGQVRMNELTVYGSIASCEHNYVLSGNTYTCSNCGDSYEIFYVSFSVPEGVDPVADIEHAKDGITLPTANAPEGYEFIGWAEAVVDNVTEKPEIFEAGDTYETEADITLYAVYTYEVAGGEGSESTDYVLTDIADISSSDSVVVTMNAGDTVYALSNSNGTSKAPIATIVTVDGNKLSAAPADDLKWNIGGDANGYIFYTEGTTSSWLYCTDTNNGVRVGTNNANTFVIDAASGYLKHSGTGRYLGVYKTNPDWRCYTSVNDNIKNQTLGFYVKTSGTSGTTYYTTVITEETVGVESWNIALGDNIGVNFVMNVAETDEVSFTVAGNAVEAVRDGNTYTVELAAAQMTDEIVITVNGVALEETYSVREYADIVLADESLSACHELVKAMLVYGGASQTVFNYNTDSMASDGITASSYEMEAAEEIVLSDNIDALNFYGASLSYRNKIAVRFYFTASLEGYTISAGDYTVTTGENNGLYYVEIAGILPQNIGEQITVTATDAEGNTISVSYGPMNYIERMSAKGSEAVQELVNALYNYYKAAAAYTAE